MDGPFARVASVVALVGLVWLWLNVDMDDMVMKVIAVGVLWAIWVGVVFVASGLIAMVLGMLGIIARR